METGWPRDTTTGAADGAAWLAAGPHAGRDVSAEIAFAGADAAGSDLAGESDFTSASAPSGSTVSTRRLLRTEAMPGTLATSSAARRDISGEGIPPQSVATRDW